MPGQGGRRASGQPGRLKLRDMAGRKVSQQAGRQAIMAQTMQRLQPNKVLVHRAPQAGLAAPSKAGATAHVHAPRPGWGSACAALGGWGRQACQRGPSSSSPAACCPAPALSAGACTSSDPTPRCSTPPLQRGSTQATPRVWGTGRRCEAGSGLGHEKARRPPDLR